MSQPTPATSLQDTAAQRRELKAAGCIEIQEEFASGAMRARPALARVLAGMRLGDVLGIVRCRQRVLGPHFHLDLGEVLDRDPPAPSR